MDYVFIIVILICGISDFATRTIPNKITFPLIVLVLVYQTYQGTLTFAFVGLAIGFGIGSICFAAKGMGGGDVKLMTAIGAYLGAYTLMSVLLVGSILSLIWGITQFLKDKVTVTPDKQVNYLKLSIPFGTCLSIAVVNSYFYTIPF